MGVRCFACSDGGFGLGVFEAAKRSSPQGSLSGQRRLRHGPCAAEDSVARLRGPGRKFQPPSASLPLFAAREPRPDHSSSPIVSRSASAALFTQASVLDHLYVWILAAEEVAVRRRTLRRLCPLRGTREIKRWAQRLALLEVRMSVCLSVSDFGESGGLRGSEGGLGVCRLRGDLRRNPSSDASVRGGPWKRRVGGSAFLRRSRGRNHRCYECLSLARRALSCCRKFSSQSLGPSGRRRRIRFFLSGKWPIRSSLPRLLHL